MCSLVTEKIRLRRAMALPVLAQNSGSSGRQSSIQWPPSLRRAAGLRTVAPVAGLVSMSGELMIVPVLGGVGRGGISTRR